MSSHCRESFDKPLLGVHIKFMQATAMWPCKFGAFLPKRISGLSKILGYVINVSVLFIAGHIAALHTKTSIDSIGGNLDDLSDFFTLTIIYSFTFFIVSYFMVRHKTLIKMFEFLEDNFKYRSSPGLTYITNDLCYTKTRHYIIVWILLCMFGVILWAAYPILIGKRILPLRCQYPFDVLQPVVYEITYFIQFLGQIIVGLAFGMVSGLYMSLVMLICGQFDILFCSLKNIFYTAQLLNGNNKNELKRLQSQFNPENEECNQYFFNVVERLEDIDEAEKDVRDKLPSYKPSSGVDKNLKKELQASLKECIKHHETILSVCEMMEDFYSPFCFIKSMQVTFQFCFLAFVFVNTTASTIRTVNLAQYLFLTLAEFLMFTFYGEVLQQQSVRVGDALLRSPWYLFGKELRKEILIVLPNIMKPVKLTGGKFFTMNVDRFQLVVGTGFSYFTLLQNIQS